MRLLIAATLLLALATPASAAEQVVTVTPSVDLEPGEAGQKILVKGAGFDPKFNSGNGYGVRIGPKRTGWRDRTSLNGWQYSKLLKENWDFGINLKPDGTWQTEPTVRARYVSAGETISAAKEPFYLLIFAWNNPDTSRDVVVPLTFKGINEPVLELRDKSVVQGGKLGFSGRHFTPGEQADLVLGSVKANDNGVIEGEVVVPKVTPPGEHELVAAGAQSKRAARAKYTVTTEACVVDTVVKGNLLWGFKRSFRMYVGNGKGNSIKGSDGAVVTDIDAPANPNGVTTGVYRYPFASATYSAPSKFEVSFGGTITFDYPGHLFTISLSKPKVTVNNKVGSLHADVELKSKPGAPAEPVKLVGVELAKLDLSAARTETGEGTLTISGVTSTLASAEAFGGFYGAGEKLDDLTITLGAACGVPPQNPGDAATAPPVTQGEDLVPPLAFRPLADTGVAPQILLAIAGFLLLGGAALRYHSRRRRS